MYVYVSNVTIRFGLPSLCCDFGFFTLKFQNLTS
jgi:hypothetical protein